MELTHRPRRLRTCPEVRSLCRETRLSPDSLIYPIFVDETLQGTRPIPSLPRTVPLRPGQRVSGGGGVPGPRRDQVHPLRPPRPQGRDRLLRLGRQRSGTTGYPMCEYTSHGHCGILCGEHVDNDATLPRLVDITLSYARAGVDMVAPSDMMDGRIGAMRKALDEAGFVNLPIMAYSAKYASSFYGPFRDAAGSAPSFGDRKGYQMDPHNAREALRECALDVEEGADILMAKPALSYLDVLYRCKQAYNLPMCAYSVSGEYAMIKAAAAAGLVDEYKMMCESALSIYRAGADMLITYSAKELADAMKRGDIG